MSDVSLYRDDLGPLSRIAEASPRSVLQGETSFSIQMVSPGGLRRGVPLAISLDA